VKERLYSVPTKWGDFAAGFTDGGLSRFEFPRGPASRRKSLPKLAPGDEPAAAGLLADLRRYFAGEPVRFRSPLDLSAGTAFQQKVWRRMQRIPYGRLVTYGRIARDVGSPGAARAVGGACGRNPVALVNPCHRVVASNGIGGFGGGLRLKRRLLRHEGVDPEALEGR